MSKLQFSLAVSLIVMLACTFVPCDLFAQLEASDSGSKMPILDPFKVLIEPKKAAVVPRISRPTVQTNQGPPPVPALVVKVTAIAGEDPDFVAIIQYQGADYIVEKNWESQDNAFKVRNVYADRLEVFYSKDKSVKTFLFD
jgi:hypothetical protein